MKRGTYVKLKEIKGILSSNKIIIYLDCLSAMTFINTEDGYFRDGKDEDKDIFEILGECVIERIYGKDAETINIDLQELIEQ